jgi:hypothetical protein
MCPVLRAAAPAVLPYASRAVAPATSAPAPSPSPCEGAETEMVDRICRLLGAPNERIWPGFSRLPAAAALRLPQQPYNYLRKASSSLVGRWVGGIGCLGLTASGGSNMEAHPHP